MEQTERVMMMKGSRSGMSDVKVPRLVPMKEYPTWTRLNFDGILSKKPMEPVPSMHTMHFVPLRHGKYAWTEPQPSLAISQSVTLSLSHFLHSHLPHPLHAVRAPPRD